MVFRKKSLAKIRDSANLSELGRVTIRTTIANNSTMSVTIDHIIPRIRLRADYGRLCCRPQEIYNFVKMVF